MTAGKPPTQKDTSYPNFGIASEVRHLECGTSDGALHSGVSNAILKLARVLARQAAREDHAQAQTRSACNDQTGSDIR